MDISTAWGYGAVIIKARGLWQGFFIPDPADPKWASSVEHAIEIAGVATKDILSITRLPVAPVGGLAATVASCLLEQDWTRVGVFASALSKITGHRFWVIEAEEDQQGDGFVTKHVPLSAQTPEEARDMIRALGAALAVDKLLRKATN